MEKITYYEVSTEEILKALQEKYNRDNNTNHQFDWHGRPVIADVAVKVVKWDKNEKTH